MSVESFRFDSSTGFLRPSFISLWGFGGIRNSAPIKRFAFATSSAVFVMPTIYLTGRILPVVAQANFSNLFPVNAGSEDLGLEMHFITTIQNNEFTIECRLNKWDTGAIFIHVYMRAFDIISGFVDLAAFASGVGLTVMFETLTDPNGNRTQLVTQEPWLAAFATINQNNFDAVARFVITNHTISRALQDLVDSLKHTHVAPLVCGRAMEGVRHAIGPNLERKKGWAKMNAVLKIDRSYLDMIVDTSKGPRHADPTHIPGDVCVEISKRSWIIMSRFFEYLARNSQPLPEADFPVLR
jgi:hypothetical protein